MATPHEQAALQIQDACNMRAVLAAWVRILDDDESLRWESGLQRPVNILFADKIFDMVGRPDCIAYGKAWDHCKGPE